MLYFVPTPIGNLSDISAYALEVLKSAEVAICEDTRVSKQLLNLLSQKFAIEFKISEFYPLHTHNEAEFFAKFDTEKFLQKTCVYLSDAGMPCISDPGVSLVKFAIKNQIPYEVLSGANALLLGVVASGIVQKEFSFLGFLPNTGKERNLAIENLMKSPYPCVIYESPKRVLNLVENLEKIDKNREIFLIKEATKKFETKFSGKICEVLKNLQTANLNGEWCVVVDKCEFKGFDRISEDDILNLEIPPKTKAKLLAKITGKNAKEIYENLIK